MENRRVSSIGTRILAVISNMRVNKDRIKNEVDGYSLNISNVNEDNVQNQDISKK
jgi:hypothetical protein